MVEIGVYLIVPDALYDQYIQNRKTQLYCGREWLLVEMRGDRLGLLLRKLIKLTKAALRKVGFQTFCLGLLSSTGGQVITRLELIMILGFNSFREDLSVISAM